MIDSALWHRRELGVCGILNDGESAAPLDFGEA